MAELNLGGIEERESGDHSRRVLTKKQTGQGMVTSPRQLQPPPPPPPRSSRGKRGKQPKKFDARFLIKEDIMVESRSDPRTTLMIKNIPNKYRWVFLVPNFYFMHCFLVELSRVTSLMTREIDTSYRSSDCFVDVYEKL